jgi:putative membrane protein
VWFMHEGAGWWMVFGGVWMLIFWGGLIALIAWGVTGLTGQGRPFMKKEPLDIARERYARGEISREEFDQIKKDLF